MVVFCRAACAPAVAAFAAVSLLPDHAHAQGNCTSLEVQLQPAISADPENRFPPQIVMWLEDESGTFRGTAFITDAVGRFGIGNRPGRYDFNSAPRWPYGRRITTFPVWARRHGMKFPDVVFQNRDESNLSHPSMQSSADPRFCAPLRREEPEWDAGSCATVGYTDKGELGATSTSFYPPRQDVSRTQSDDAAVDMYDELNPFDIVSHATPTLGELANLVYSIPDDVLPGNYTLWVEVSKEFDMNGTYNPTEYPSPDVEWSTFGLAYRGQPSVIYKVDITIDETSETVARTAEYIGYGDPDGVDGEIRPPDATITANMPGSGSSRLALISEDGQMFRVKVVAKPEYDSTAPAMPADFDAIRVKSGSATLAFTAPGDDGQTGRATRYEVRIRAGEEITAENFASSQLVATKLLPDVGGATQEIELERLLWETDYSVGIRAVDNCENVGPLSVVSFRTLERAVGEVDACFVATAAYGSPLATEIQPLRRFRDKLLRESIFGELAVEAYYTFGPALSGVIGESEVLRATTRGVLEPIVRAAKGAVP